MAEDPELKKRLDAAYERATTFAAEELARGDSRNRAPVQEPATAPEVQAESTSQRADVDEEADGIPEVNEIDGEEDLESPAKRARVGSRGAESETVREVQQSADDEESGDEQPEPKRPRSRTLSFAVRVSWADLTEGEENVSALELYSLKCNHCDAEFSSRNALFAHLRGV